MSATLRTFGSLAVAVWLGAGLLFGTAAVAQSSQFKGWSAVWTELSARIAPRDVPLAVDRFLPAEDMEDLLGTWSTFAAEHDFRNGYPNSLSMMIWQVAMSGFADAMGQSCSRPDLEFNASFKAVLDRVCTWPEAQARSDEALTSFWLAIMGFNAPQEEYLAWREFLRAAIDLGVPAPAIGASLAYYDAYRSSRLPVNLIQAQRDYFSAHTYQRIDRSGVFHTLWDG